MQIIDFYHIILFRKSIGKMISVIRLYFTQQDYNQEENNNKILMEGATFNSDDMVGWDQIKKKEMFRKKISQMRRLKHFRIIVIKWLIYGYHYLVQKV